MVEKTNAEITEEHKKISFTADHHPFFRTHYGMPYTQDVYEFMQAKRGAGAQNGQQPLDVNLNLDIIPVFEARYKGTNAIMRRLIENYGIRQVLSLAAGMEERGIVMASDYPGMVYVEADISDVFKEKAGLADKIFEKYKLRNREGLHFEIADALIPEQIEGLLWHFSRDKKILIVNEGLMSYYSESDNGKYADINHSLMQRFDRGFWVTSDMSMNAKNRKVFFSHAPGLPAAQKRIGQQTGKPYDENGFRDNEHALEIMDNAGLNVKRFGKNDLKYNLNSLGKVGLDEATQMQVSERLGDKNNGVQAWVMSLK